MRTAAIILALLCQVASSATAQTVTVTLSPGKMERMGLSFAVQTVPLTNATQFTVAVSCAARHPALPKDYYATLRTGPEPPVLSTRITDGKPVVTRARMSNEKGERIAPSAGSTNQTNSVTYAFPVPNDKLADAAFMFWVPAGRVPERCYRVDLKPFAEKK